MTRANCSVCESRCLLGGGGVGGGAGGAHYDSTLYNNLCVWRCMWQGRQGATQGATHIWNLINEFLACGGRVIRGRSRVVLGCTLAFIAWPNIGLLAYLVGQSKRVFGYT